MCKIINKVKKLFGKCCNKAKNNKGDISVTTVIIWVGAIGIALAIVGVIKIYEPRFVTKLTNAFNDSLKP